MTTLASAISDLSNTLGRGHGIETTEDALFEIVEMLRGNGGLKVQFLAMVERSFTNASPSGLSENGVPRELVELTTHELKWPEFAILADRRIRDVFGGNDRLAISDVSHGVKQAYADDWEDCEFFQKYTS